MLLEFPREASLSQTLVRRRLPLRLNFTRTMSSGMSAWTGNFPTRKKIFFQPAVLFFPVRKMDG
jgi:hypothetical protein